MALAYDLEKVFFLLSGVFLLVYTLYTASAEL